MLLTTSQKKEKDSMMETSKPIKRSQAIVPLSRDHHNGLLLCWKIRTGLKNNISIDRIAAYIIHVFDTELYEHFYQEEKYLFPLIPSDNPKNIQAHKEHISICNQINILRNKVTDKAALSIIADELEAHIRFEERDLFNYIEQHADTLKLETAGKLLQELHEISCSDNWDDEFWIKRQTE